MEREQDNAAAERKRPKRDRDHPPLEGRFRHGFRLLCLCCFGGKARRLFGVALFLNVFELFRLALLICFPSVICFQLVLARHTARGSRKPLRNNGIDLRLCKGLFAPGSAGVGIDISFCHK